MAWACWGFCAWSTPWLFIALSNELGPALACWETCCWGSFCWAICAAALARGRAGGTLALNIPANWERGRTLLAATLTRARDEQGWHVHAMPSLEGLVAFARAFSRQKFGPASAAPAPVLAP